MTATLDAPCPPEGLAPFVDDLARYPAWMPLVHRATPAGPLADSGEPAWDVELRARLGPLARSKRLRMVRVLADAPTAYRFERDEADGRRHSSWVLSVRVDGVGAGHSRLTMRLHYGGGLWGGMLERVLADGVEEARHNLLALVTASAAPSAGA